MVLKITRTIHVLLCNKRNIDRFPEDFCFQLTEDEVENYGGRRYLPYVYTEQGISMLAGVLKNEIAIQVSIIIKNYIM